MLAVRKNCKSLEGAISVVVVVLFPGSIEPLGFIGST